MSCKKGTTGKEMLRHTLVSHFLEFSAERFPDKTALVHQGKRLTYREVDSMANKLALALIKSGLERGDRAVIFMDNSIEAVVSVFAILKAGAVFMMVNHTTKAEKLEYVMNNSRARTMLTQSGREAVVKDTNCPYLKTIIMAGPCSSGLPCIPFEDVINSERSETVRSKCIDLDLASIIYTSGSTGHPKGVMLSNLNMVSAAHSITTYLENNENDVIINMLPLSFDYGLYQILMGFKIGGTVVLEKSFIYPAQVIKTMAEEKVTGFPACRRSMRYSFR